MPPLAVLPRQWWISSRKLAEKHLVSARQLISSQDPADIYSALSLIDSALKLCPQLEKALELKARALLCLRRFRDVANMFCDYIPSMKFQTVIPENLESSSKETVKLLSNYTQEEKSWKKSFLKFFCVAKLKKKLISGISKRNERERWRYLVLGQACCHLGMMEDAMILLQNGKKSASAVFRKQSNCMREDSFCPDVFTGSELDPVSHLLGNIKFLLRRRTAALAALEAGLYSESVRHFSKIVDGRKGTPQGFIAECYMHRATAYQAAGRVIDAIADYNRTLALNPMCAQALNARAALFEMVRCFSECLQDLEQLKLLNEAFLVQQKYVEPIWTHHQNPASTDLQGSVDHINNRIMSIRQRWVNHCTMDYYLLLGLARGCTRADVERAFLLIYLKHRPDKAAHFVDRCELVDDRDIEVVKDEARSSALKLFRLIQRAYSGLLSTIMQEAQRNEKKRIIEFEKDEENPQVPCSRYDGDTVEGPNHHPPLLGAKQDLEPSVVIEDNANFSGDDDWLDNALHREGVAQGENQLLDKRPTFSLVPALRGSSLIADLDSEENYRREKGGGGIYSSFSSFGSVQQELDVLDASGFSAASACRNVTHGVPDSWMSTPEWSHQTHTPRPFSVT